MTELRELLDALPWFAWVAIAAIVFGSINTSIAQIIAHRERMEKINNGVDPDADNGNPE